VTGSDFDEAELLEAVRTGEPSAGPVLVSAVAPGLLPYAHSIASDLTTTDIELLCEVAVERAVEKIERFDPTRGTLSAWVRGILRMEIQAERRKRGAAPLPLREDLVAAVAAPPRVQEIPEEVVAAIGNLVRLLRQTDQIILQLRSAEEMPYQAISALLGADEAACRQRHLRACRRLAALAADNPVIQAFLQQRRGDND
jgi:RNA polymerase sigma factor (sigma-70 family)